MLTKEERETTINFNESEDLASVEVAVGNRLYKRLMKLGKKPINEYKLAGKVVSVVFEVPKNWIKVNPGKQLSNEQKAACSDRAHKNFSTTQPVE